MKMYQCWVPYVLDFGRSEGTNQRYKITLSEKWGQSVSNSILFTHRQPQGSKISLASYAAGMEIPAPSVRLGVFVVTGKSRCRPLLTIAAMNPGTVWTPIHILLGNRSRLEIQPSGTLQS